MIAPVITVSSELIFCGNIADVLKIDIKGPPPRAAVISALGANPTQMYQDLLLPRRPARASMGSQELIGNAMDSSGSLGRPHAGRIDEVPIV